MKFGWIYFDNSAFIELYTECFTEGFGHEAVFVEAKDVREKLSELAECDVFVFYRPYKDELEALLCSLNLWSKKLVLWTTDDPYEIDYTVSMATSVNLIVTSGESSAAFLEDMTRTPVIVNQLGASKTFIEAGAQSLDPNYKSDVCFFGGAFPYRITILRAIKRLSKTLDVLISGPGWQERTVDLGFRTIEPCSLEETAKYYRNSLCCLSLHRMIDMNIANSDNVFPVSLCRRDFEILGTGGGMLLSDDSRKDALKRHFDDRHCMTFQWLNVEDLARKLEFIIGRESAVRDIAKMGRERVLANFQWSKMLHGTLDMIELWAKGA